MNREEILSYINYQGEYTRDVKKKLNKLIKKYHPDRNKIDKTTILTLYEVKKDLEKNKIAVVTEPVKDEEVKEEIIDFEVANPLIERILKILKNKKKFIENSLKRIYRKEYYYSNKIYKDSYDLGLLDLKIKELNKKQQNLKKITKYDYMLLAILLIILIFAFYKPILIIFIVIPILFELLYINYRTTIFYENNLLKENLEEKKKTFTEKQKNCSDNLADIKKEELRLKREKRSINNDIAFYNHELSKSNKNEKVSTVKKGNSYSKRREVEK